MKTVPRSLGFEEKDTLGIGYLIRGSAKQAITEIQTQVLQALGDSIKLQPTELLHITTISAIQPKHYGRPRSEIIQQYGKSIEAGFTDYMETFQPFDVHFSAITVSPQAIILIADDPRKMNAVRQELLQRFTLPEESKAPPNITHSTIARFNKEVDVATVQKALTDIQISVPVHIDKLELFHDFGYNTQH